MSETTPNYPFEKHPTLPLGVDLAKKNLDKRTALLLANPVHYQPNSAHLGEKIGQGAFSIVYDYEGPAIPGFNFPNIAKLPQLVADTGQLHERWQLQFPRPQDKLALLRDNVLTLQEYGFAMPVLQGAGEDIAITVGDQTLTVTPEIWQKIDGADLDADPALVEQLYQDPSMRKELARVAKSVIRASVDGWVLDVTGTGSIDGHQLQAYSKTPSGLPYPRNVRATGRQLYLTDLDSVYHFPSMLAELGIHATWHQQGKSITREQFDQPESLPLARRSQDGSLYMDWEIEKDFIPEIRARLRQYQIQIEGGQLPSELAALTAPGTQKNDQIKVAYAMVRQSADHLDTILDKLTVQYNLALRMLEKIAELESQTTTVPDDEPDSIVSLPLIQQRTEPLRRAA